MERETQMPSKGSTEKMETMLGSEAERTSAMFDLCADYDSMFIVDLDTDTVEDIKVDDRYASAVFRIPDEPSYKARVLNGVERNVVPEDQERVRQEFDAEHVYELLNTHGSYFSIYRVRGNDSRGIYHRAKFAQAKDPDHRRLVLGIKDVDREIRVQYQQMVALQGLAYDFESIFYVILGKDASQDRLRKFRSSELLNSAIPEMGQETSFAECLSLILDKFVCKEHRDYFESQIKREDILKRFEDSPSFCINFQAVDEHYYQAKFSADSDGGKVVGIIFGIQNIDVPYRNELDRQKRIEKLVEERTADLEEKNRTLSRVSEGVLELLGELVEKRSEESGAHIQRVKTFTEILARSVMQNLPRYGLTEHDISIISYVSPLHDFGKIMIPDQILTKPGKLSDDEFDVVKTHCEVGHSLIKKMESVWDDEYIEVAGDVCLNHHEKWNGDGYPRGLKGDEIPISAQIVSIADIYDALTTERCYKHAYPPEVATQMIVDGECGSFSDDLIQCFLKCRPAFENFSKDPKAYEASHLEENLQSLFGSTDRIARYSMKLKQQNENLIRQKNDFFSAMPVIKQMGDSMPGGFFMYHAGGNRELIYFNDRVVEIFGCDSREDFIEYTNNSFDGMVHPDDFNETQKSIEQQVTENPSEQDHVVYRIIRKDGSICWLDDYGQLVHSETFGDLFYVFILDITENYNRRKNALMAEIAAEERRLREQSEGESRPKPKHLEGLSVLLVDDQELGREMTADILTDEGAAVTQACNGREAVELFREGHRFDLVLMDIVMPVMNGVDATREICAQAERSGRKQFAVIALTAEGSDTQIQEIIKAGAIDCMYKPLQISELSRILIRHMSQTSSEMEKRLAEANARASTDSLTKVKSIVAYTDMVAQLSSEIVTNPSFDMGVVMCDCDGLKKVNDTYGHDAGDQYIKNCCRIICETFRHSPVFRIGGDEFAVIVRGDDLAQADALMEEMLLRSRSASKLPTIQDGRAVLSAGFARYDRYRNDTFSDVMKRADEAMYNNKMQKKRLS